MSYGNTNTEKPENTISSEISEVTVYLSGAQITRKASLTIQEGTTTAIFEGLSPFIDENSIQISGLEDASILSIKYGLNYLNKPKYPEKVQNLKDKRKNLELQIARINSEIDGFSKEEEVLNTNKRLGSEAIEVNLEKVKEMASYYRNRLTEIRNEIINANTKKELLKKELNTLSKQFAEFNVSDESQKGVITLKLNSERDSDLNLNMTYIVSEAGWFPTYDIRANRINSPVELLYKSHIFQKTGVDWDDVNLVLSTGDPNTDNNKPVLDTKFLNFVRLGSYKNTSKAVSSFKYKYNPNIRNVSGTVYEENGPLPGATVLITGTNQGTQTDFEGKFNLEVNTGENLQISYVGYQTKQIPVHASSINVTLEPDSSLDEVLITANGIKREKKALGYAITESLSGKASGINSTPSSASNVTIRGYNSINANNQALYIVDGVPFNGGDLNSYSYGNSNSGKFLDLDSNNIASVNVLKGAAATSLYGTSGRNGVIVITTKAGTGTGQLKVEDLTTTRFEISKPYTIQTDGDVTVIKIDNFQVPTEYEYYAAPLLNENVFLTAKIKNWEQYSLLPGEANIYFEGGFSGKTYIDPLATTSELSISLGSDPNVIVKRKQLDNFKASSFIGNQRIVNNEFELKVKNNKNYSINLKLVDRIPKTQNREIKVDEIETGDSVYEKETGILNWVLTISPNSSIDKRFSYRVKYPKFKRINL